MTKADPELRQIVDEGIEIEKAWLADKLQTARDMERIAAPRKTEAQQVLGAKRTEAQSVLETKGKA